MKLNEAYADGNLTSDGNRNLAWTADGARSTQMAQRQGRCGRSPTRRVSFGQFEEQNRLKSVEPALLLTGAEKIEFEYDYLGRRIQKTVSEWNGSFYAVTSDQKFLYDGWTEHESAEMVQALLVSAGPNGQVPFGRAFGNLIATFTLSDLQPFELSKTHTWGLDLSQSLQGAGGVGGLLGVEDLSGTYAGVYHFAFDANGNVSEVLDSTGNFAAHYEYSPFGEVIRSSGSYADENAWRFSTKYFDVETDFYYYGFRYYDPETGRWLSRDPLEQVTGGLAEMLPEGPNLYAYVGNNPVNGVDPLGLWNLWNPLTYGLPSQPGENPWNPLDSSAEWGATGEGATKGAAAYADGINPFGDPWQDLGVYDPCKDRGTGASQWLGKNVGRNALYTAGGLRAGQALTRGRELVFRSGGQVTGRLNLFGSRTGPLSSRFPHYHRRGPGGIGQHRPWQGFSPSSPHSGNVLNRF